MRFVQGLGSLGLAAVGIWMLVLVGDPVAAATSLAAFALLCVAWVVRPKRGHGTETHSDDDDDGSWSRGRAGPETRG